MLQAAGDKPKPKGHGWFDGRDKSPTTGTAGEAAEQRGNGRGRQRQEGREQKDERGENDRESEREVGSRSETGVWDAMTQTRIGHLWPKRRETPQGLEDQRVQQSIHRYPIPHVSDDQPCDL